MAVWFKTGQLLLQGANIYEGLDHFGYAPFWAYWAAVAQYAYGLLDNKLPFWRLVVKLPQIGGLLLWAYLLRRPFQGAQEEGGHRRWIQLPMWLYLGFVAGIWGQLNTLSALSVLLGLRLLWKERPYASAISLGYGIALKLYPVVAFPLFLARSHSKGGWGSALRYLGVAFIPITASTVITFGLFGWEWLPFLKTLFYQPFSILCERCAGPRPLMNFWSLVWLFDPALVSAWFSQLLWLPIWLLVAALTRRMPAAIMLVSLYLTFIALFPRVSEQSAVDLLPFLLLTQFMTPTTRFVKLGLVVLPLIALLFSMLNFGLTLFAPLVAEFNQAGPQQIDAMYATHRETLSLLMGAVGALATIISLLLLFRLVRRSPKSELPLQPWLTSEKPFAVTG
jgi:hypothetical protein